MGWYTWVFCFGKRRTLRGVGFLDTYTTTAFCLGVCIGSSVLPKALLSERQPPETLTVAQEIRGQSNVPLSLPNFWKNSHAIFVTSSFKHVA